MNENIKLEILTRSDKAELFRLIDKNRDNLRKFIDWADSTKSEDDLNKFFEDNENMYHDRKGCNYKIIEDNSIIGVIGFFQNGRSESVYEIGYWLDSDKRNRGIMSSLIPEIEYTIFSNYNAEKIEIWCAAKNTGSNRVAQKNHYKLERRIEKHKKLYGVFLDYNIYCKAGNDCH
jgi:ribosomal-protein-serine acetyltransferase